MGPLGETRGQQPPEGAAEPRYRPGPDAGGEVTFRPVRGWRGRRGRGLRGRGRWRGASRVVGSAGAREPRHRPRVGGGEEARGPKFAKSCFVFGMF